MGLGDDLASELAFWEGVEFCNLVEHILVSSKGSKWRDAEAQVSEHDPASLLRPYEHLRATKRLLILSHPLGGEAVWLRFVSALDADHKPASPG
jgi:hypothetical protein